MRCRAKYQSDMGISLEILMATYNSEDWIVPQLESILSQTFSDFKLLIRDDGSTDRTLELVDEFVKRDSRVVVVPTDGRHLGAAQNFSALLDVAEADYVMFSDHDDVWIPEKVELSLNAIHEVENRSGSDVPILVHTDLSIVGAQLQLQAQSFWRYAELNPQHDRSPNRLLVRNNVTGCTMLFNRALVQLARPVPEAAQMHDHWIALVASAFGEIVCIDQPTVLYRQHGKNLVGVKNRRGTRNIIQYIGEKGFFQVMQEYCEILQRNQELFRGQATAFLERYNDQLSPHHIEMLHDYINLRQMKAVPRRIAIIKHSLYCAGFKNKVALLLFS